MNSVFLRSFSFSAIAALSVACGNGPVENKSVSGDMENPGTEVPDSVETIKEPLLDKPIELSFSNFENLVKKSKLLSDKEAFALGLDTVSWENYLAKDFGDIDGCNLKLVFSAIETQQLGFLIYTKAGQIRKKIDCYADDQVEAFRLITSVITKDLALQTEKKSALEGECAYMKLEQDLKSINSKPVVIEKNCTQTQDE